MNNWMPQVLAGGAALIGGLLVAALLIFTGVATEDPKFGPQQAFEAHLLALDAQDWALANRYVTEWCQGDVEGMEMAGDDLDRSGFSFYRAFPVAAVWFHENGIAARLDLLIPPGLLLPSRASMELVDGEWLVTCTG